MGKNRNFNNEPEVNDEVIDAVNVVAETAPEIPAAEPVKEEPKKVEIKKEEPKKTEVKRKTATL